MDEKTLPLRIVAIGGGTGLSTLLAGLKVHVGRDVDDLSAIVAVTDDGGSSGRLRAELQMPPPGDIRNCMVALSEDSNLLSRLFRHRFAGEGDLAGHNFGNLFLAALTEVTGDFGEAVRLSSEILASKGHIYPATVADVRVAASLVGGAIVQGETNISRSRGRIDHVFLEPEDCHPMPDAIAAITAADVITVGPGSLYTSLIPPLLVHGIAEAIASSNAVKIFICNLMTQPGETDGMTSQQHLEVIKDHAPDVSFDLIVVNDRPISARQAQLYNDEGAEQIGIRGPIDKAALGDAKLCRADLLEEGDMVRHDPAKLARVILDCRTL